MNIFTSPGFQKLGKLVLSALWVAVSATLAKTMEPLLKWLLFLSFRGMIWLLPSGKVENAVLDLRRELRKSYGERDDVEYPMGHDPKAPGAGNHAPGWFGSHRLHSAREDRGPERGEGGSGHRVQPEGGAGPSRDGGESPGRSEGGE